MTETTNIVGDAADVSPSPDTIIGGADGAKVTEGGVESVVADLAGAKPEDAKVESQAEAVVPEKYGEFKMPEGVELPKGLQERVEPLFKELKLTQEQAQKAAEFLGQERMDALKANAEEYTNYVKQLAEMSRADKEIGGEKLAETASHANQFIQKFGRGEKGAEVFKVLDETGMGNHPAIISLLAKAHKAMSDDSPSKGSPATNERPSVETIMYPTMASK